MAYFDLAARARLAPTLFAPTFLASTLLAPTFPALALAACMAKESQRIRGTAHRRRDTLRTSIVDSLFSMKS